jgi:hypothetical protein
MNNFKTWLIAWVDLLVALVIIITAARVRLDWDSRIRWHLHIKQELLKNQEEEVIGI